VGGAQRIGKYGTSGGPGLAVIDGKLYCFHEGDHQNGQIWYTIYDGSSWSADTKANLSTSGPPGLAVAHLGAPGASRVSGLSGPSGFFDVCFFCWEGSFQNNTAHTINNVLHTDEIIANMTIDGPPGMTVYANTLLAVYATPTGVLSVRTTPIATPAAQTFNLRLPTGRQTAPYNSLPYYSTDLQPGTSTLRSDQYPVQVNRHHIIPYNRLFEFWNRLVENSQLGQGTGPADGLLRGIIATLRSYQFGTGNNNIVPADRDNIITLLEGMLNGTIRHDPNPDARPPDEIDNLAAVYQWLPGNLFVGPQNRSDDPGANFEEQAIVVVGIGNFEMYATADQAIQNYLAAPPRSIAATEAAEQAANNLSDVATITDVFPLVKDNWVLVSGGKSPKYKLASIKQLERVARAAMAPAGG
jgi:hypothetical protein